eukprot:scaffold12038_cov61-Phaeocystis_antarctica.AAC.1
MVWHPAAATPLEAALTPCFCGVQVLAAVLQAGRGRQSGGEPWRGNARPSAPAQRCYIGAGPATLSLTRAQVMRGDRVMNSPYDIKMHIEESCKVRHAGCTERQREAAVGGPSVGPWQAIVGL